MNVFNCVFEFLLSFFIFKATTMFNYQFILHRYSHVLLKLFCVVPIIIFIYINSWAREGWIRKSIGKVGAP